MIWRYMRQFVKMDAKEALQYVYCVCLAADQPDVGKEQVESAWELVRRIIVLSNSGPAWEELVGGFRADGSRFVSTPNLYQRQHTDRDTERCHRTGNIFTQTIGHPTFQRPDSRPRSQRVRRERSYTGGHQAVRPCWGLCHGHVMSGDGVGRNC